MPSKRKRSKSGRKPRANPAVVQARAVAQPAPAAPQPVARPRRQANPAPSFQMPDIVPELRMVGIIGGLVVVALVVLYYVL